MEKQVSNVEQNSVKTMTEVRKNLEVELLNYLAESDANFKSQQKDDPELTFEEKRTIANNLLQKSHCLFLAKFGHYLREEHLKYFDNVKDENYEISYHINRLRRHLNNSIRQRDIKNRRYEALKKLIEEGEYFSECEMMKRNPLLYEQLVGQYLTKKQKETRDNIDMKSTTFVHLLMESIERDWAKEHEKLQKEEEDNVLEENDSDDDNDDDDEDIDENCSLKQSNLKTKPNKSWGELSDVQVNKEDENETKHIYKYISKISNKEKEILKEEFVTHMYQSFLEGKDPDFDYRY